MTLKELAEKYGEDTEVALSVYSCGQIFTVNIDEQIAIKVEEKKGTKKIIIDAEYN